MPLIINTNMASLNAQRNLMTSQSALQTSLQRLSSGLRINSAKDDAAGLAISTRMGAQVNGLAQAARNANDGISMAQTAEGALGQISDNLQRMRELSVQAANGTNSTSDRAAIQAEITQLSQEIDRVATQTAFNGTNLIDGSLTNATFQIGANSGQSISMSLANVKAGNILGGAGNGSQGLVGSGPNTTALTGAAGGTIAFSTSTNGTTSNQGTSTLAATVNDGVSYVGGVQSGTTSALASANAINLLAGNTGVVASASNSWSSGTITSSAGFTAGTMKINGVDIGAVAPTSNASGQASSIIQAINNVSGQTGVTAVANTAGTGYNLFAADGRNIDIVSTGAVAVTGFAAATTTVYGQVTLSEVNANTKFQTAGTAATNGVAASSSSVLASASSGVNVTTQAGASASITAIDSAIATISSQRALLGAMQNRFQNVINSLQTTGENLTASRSRIQDTDFASETATLTRGQILQQAGTAMLAQANSLPNGVMALLR